MSDEKFPPSAVREAMEILGGMPIDLAVVCRVTDQGAKKWLKQGRVPDSKSAALIARATLAAGHPITVDRLAGLDEVDGTAPIDPVEASGRGRVRRTSPSSR